LGLTRRRARRGQEGCSRLRHLDEAEADAEIFVSPSEEDLTFESAQRAITSLGQNQVHAYASSVMHDVDDFGIVWDAIGDWSDGAENSLILLCDVADRQRVRYIAALLGDKWNQKTVIPFVPSLFGKDVVYFFSVSKSPAQVRAGLDKEGIKYRTIEPRGATTRVWVFDEGGKMGDLMEKVGEHYDLEINFIRGTGEYLGGDTREEGHAAYKRVFEEYESTHEPHEGRNRKFSG